MLSSNASKVLRILRKKNDHSGKISYDELMEIFHWTWAQSVSACDQLIEKDLAKQTMHHSVKGNPYPSGIILKEEGRFYYRYTFFKIVNGVFHWMLEHILELATFILAIVSFLNSI